MAEENQTVKVILAIATAAAVLGALWMIAEVGISESWTVVKDPSEASAETNQTFGGTGAGNITFDERILVFGAFLTILGPTGFGAIAVSRKQPAAMNTLVRYGPLLIGSIALVSMGTTLSNVFSGDYDWESTVQGDGYHAFVLFATGAAVSAGAALVGLMGRK